MSIQERSQPSSETESSTNPISSMQADHVFIGVDDYEQIKQWYIEKLDFTVDLEWTVDELPGMKLGYLCKGDFRIELIGDDQGSRIPIPTGFVEHLKNKGFQHLAFRVNRVDTVMTELEKRGVDAFIPAASYPNIGRRVSLRVNGKYVTTLSGPFDSRLDRDYQTANAIENLKYCAELAESAGIILCIEPITGKWWQGTFVTTMSHAYLIVKAVNSPSVKLVFDTFQVQMESGNIIETIDRVWDEIVCFQIADVPRRTEPTSGEMNYQSILKHIYFKGYTGLIEMEHSLSQPGRTGEKAVLDIYDELDRF